MVSFFRLIGREQKNSYSIPYIIYFFVRDILENPITKKPLLFAYLCPFLACAFIDKLAFDQIHPEAV